MIIQKTFPLSIDSFTTGVPTLDRALEGALQPGKYILMCAREAGGKTVMAVQFAGYAVSGSKNVLFLSTEVDDDGIESRLACSFCNIDADSPVEILHGIQFQDIGAPGAEMLVPDIEKYGADASNAYYRLAFKLRERLSFSFLESLTFNPKDLLRERLNDYVRLKGHSPDIVILDYIDVSAALGVDKMRGAAVETSTSLKSLAEEFGFLAVAFCQADPTIDDDIHPSMIAEYKEELAEPADAFIGLSRRLAEGGEPARGNEAIRQTFTVYPRDKPSVQIPVDTNYRYQRCEAVSEKSTIPDITPASEAVSPVSKAVMAILRRDPKFLGFVLLGRQCFDDVMDLGNPNCLNVYVLLLLAAKYKESKAKHMLGSSFMARETMAKKLGLTAKKVLTATQRLHDAGIITIDAEERKQPRGRALLYHVTNWEDEQDPKTAKNYLKLFRNLRGPTQDELVGDPDLFRMWLYCLVQAQGLASEATALQPGIFLWDSGDFETRFLQTRTQTETLQKRLIDAGRIVHSVAADGMVEVKVTNWELYQKHVHPPKADRNRPGDGVGRQANAMTDPIEQLASTMTAECEAREKAAGKPAPNPWVNGG